jgi:hypothetical protein
MGSDLNANGLKSLTTEELQQLWVEACRSWAAYPDVEPPGIAELEAELDIRNEGLPFHVVREELTILARGRKSQ